MNAVGSLAWARQTGGRITFAERMTLARAAVAGFAVELPSYVAYRLGLKRRFPDHVDLDTLTHPDTAAARAAETLVRELTPPFMVNHSLRTYWFSRLIGDGAGISYDDEMLYVASLIHDLGFYGRYRDTAGKAECFSLRGANAALELVSRHGWNPARAERVAEAITLHVNGAVALEAGREAYLMQRGVLLDVTGMYAWNVHPKSLDAVFARLPMLDQRESLWPVFSEEADRYPACRGHFARRWLGFGLLVKLAPRREP